jgi:hypothetical protein
VTGITLLTFAACWSLQHTLKLASNLQALSHELMVKDSICCLSDRVEHLVLFQTSDEARMKKILTSINTALPDLLLHVMTLITRPTFDKLTIVAMHSLILGHTHFVRDSPLVGIT